MPERRVSSEQMDAIGRLGECGAMTAPLLTTPSLRRPLLNHLMSFVQLSLEALQAKSKHSVLTVSSKAGC